MKLEAIVLLLFGVLKISLANDELQYYTELTMMLAPFYSRLNDTQRGQFLEIVKNMDTAKAQRTDEIEKWAQQQPQEIQV